MSEYRRGGTGEAGVSRHVPDELDGRVRAPEISYKRRPHVRLHLPNEKKVSHGRGLLAAIPNLFHHGVVGLINCLDEMSVPANLLQSEGGVAYNLIVDEDV